MATKRTASEAGGAESSSGAPPTKKTLLTQFEPVKIGAVYSLEEMDLKVLQFQNRKLAERLQQRRKVEDDLRQRIEQLEQRQTTDDAVLVIVNRYWNQLDEDVRVLLQRFDAESADEDLKENESPAVTSFLTLLSQWDRPEIEEKMTQRVEFSKRAVGKLLTAYDRILQHNDKLWAAIKDKDDAGRKKAEDSEMSTDNKDKLDVSMEKTDGIKLEINDLKKEPSETSMDAKPENSSTEVKSEEKAIILTDLVREEVERLMEENKRLQASVTELHQKHHQISLQNSDLCERLAAAETEVAELKNQVDDLEYCLASSNQTVEKLDRHLAEAQQCMVTYQEGDIKVQGGGEGVSKNTFNEIAHELEEQRELAANRHTELEKLNQEHQQAIKEAEKLKMDIATLPETVIVDTTEYKVLQSQFSVLYNESMAIKQQHEDARSLLQATKAAHLRQIEQMESEELLCQKKLRTEVIQLEDQLAQVRREYEMLRIEFEQTLAANEQTGPINREMRNLISSLKNHNEQLKGEVQRYKRKLKEAQADINKLKAAELKAGLPPPTTDSDREDKSSSGRREEAGTPVQHTSPPAVSSKEERVLDEERTEENRRVEGDTVRELRTELKRCQDRERDLKLLLDMYKSTSKETRDKAQLMMSERKMKQEIDELKSHIRKLQESERKERRKLAEEDALRKIKRMEESIGELQKALTLQKQEEETLLSEMEVTGQAFEDMQEQNIRLMQQLREKDDANFKLMSERIKSNQIQKLMREEKDVLGEQVVTLQMQVEAQNQVVRKLEEKERIIANNLSTVEKECGLRQQTLESHKRKAVESSQTAADLKLHLDKYHAQLREAQLVVADKTSALQQQTFKYKRMQEEIASARRKLERAKKIEMASSADEVLMEEIREYKEQLTCPSCKVKKKDAVLTKCFHVFCLECLKTRYETRQRKCPKCNATFGANDYHRIYLE